MQANLGRRSGGEVKVRTVPVQLDRKQFVQMQRFGLGYRDFARRYSRLTDQGYFVGPMDEVDCSLNGVASGKSYRHSSACGLLEAHMGFGIEGVRNGYDDLLILQSDGYRHEPASRVFVDQADGLRIEQRVVEIYVRHANAIGDGFQEIFLPYVPTVDEELGNGYTGDRLLVQEGLQDVFGEQPAIDQELTEFA